MVSANFVRGGVNHSFLKEPYGMEADWPSLSTQFDRGSLRPNPRRTPLSQTPNRRPTSLSRMTPQENRPNLIAQIPTQGGNVAPKNPKLYKTELCRSWMDSGRCNYGERCQYAHGEEEKRPIPRHPKYKTEACQSYHQSGYCPYGPRCHFIHNEEPQVLAQLVAANAAAVANSSPKPPTPQSPSRPMNLFNRSAITPTHPTQPSTPQQQQQQQQRPANNVSAIATAAALAAAAYNEQPHLFSRQFQTQLQIFNNDGVKPVNTVSGLNESNLGSTGDSPIPSSNDSGTESPICPFSPAIDFEDPSFFLGSRVHSAAAAKPPQPKSWNLSREFAELGIGGLGKQTSADPLNLLPSSLSSDVESGFVSSSSSTASNGKSLNSPPIGSPPAVGLWSAASVVSAVGTPPARLPVFERLSNGP